MSSNNNDVYSEAINAVAEFYSIERDVCIEYFWDEIESYMNMMYMMKVHNDRNRLRKDSE